MDAKCYIYQIPGVRNMRDLGGYETMSGQKTAHGGFIRSTALANIDKQGEDKLLEIGVDCVIDLRSTMERQLAPDVIEGHERIHFVHVPMLDYIQSNFVTGDLTGFPSSMPEMYRGLLDNAADNFRAVFDLFSDERFGRYLFHCTAGKDRTGITAMLLLKLAGVGDDAVIEDYTLTESLLEPVAEGTYPDFIPKYIFGAKQETMYETLGHLEQKYGGASGYLKHIGIDGAKQSKILKKLISGAQTA